MEWNQAKPNPAKSKYLIAFLSAAASVNKRQETYVQ